MYGGEDQPRGSSLTSYTQAAAEAWVSCQCSFGAEASGERAETQAEPASANADSCGEQAGEIYKGSTAAVMAIGSFFSSESRVAHCEL